MKAFLGLDISMNSTGCVFHIHGQDGQADITKFMRICPSVEKNSESAELVTYNRTWAKGNYSTMDLATVVDAKRLAARISGLIKRFTSQYGITELSVRTEGHIMGGRFQKQSRMTQMVSFNTIMKLMLLSNNTVTDIATIAPTALKKYATGKGRCKKEEIVKHFMLKFPDFDRTGKIDDIADAYFLATAQLTKEKGWCKSTNEYNF